MKSEANRYVETIVNLGDELSLPVHQALIHSAPYASTYLREHTAADSGLTPETASLLATARLQWLLRAARRELSGVFSERELHTLLNCYLAPVFDPRAFRDLASPVCHSVGIEVDEYESFPIRELVDKLLRLTASQRVALADALEQAWHRRRERAWSPQEVLAQLGIELL